MSIQIREVLNGDFDGVLRLSRQFYEEAGSTPNFGDYVYLKKPTRKNMRNWFTRTLEQKKMRRTSYFVAVEGSKIVGHCFIKPIDSPPSEISHVGNISVFVSRDFRNRHIGSNLLKRSLNDAGKKFDTVQLLVIKTNAIAKHVYKKLGFKTWGVAPGYVKRGRKYMDLEYMYIKV